MFDRNQPRTTQSEYFSIIYHAALNRNTQPIEAALKEVSINLLDTQAQTPVERLITQNELGAVNFLCEHFDVSDSALISGYAAVGNVAEVRAILKRTMNKQDRFALLIDALDGFARCEIQHPGLVDDYLFVLSSISNVDEELLECELAVFNGYTVTNNIIKAFQIYSRNENQATKNIFLQKRAYALALTCNKVAMRNMKNDAWYGLETDLVPEFLSGLARGNHLDELEILIKQLGSLSDEYLKVVAGGFAISGLEHNIPRIFHRVSLPNRKDFLNHIVEEYIQGGFFGAAKRVLMLDMIPSERIYVVEILINKFIDHKRFYEYYNIYLLAVDRESKKIVVNTTVAYCIEQNNLESIRKIIKKFDDAFRNRMDSISEDAKDDDVDEMREVSKDPFFINHARKNLIRYYASRNIVDEINSMLGLLQTNSQYLKLICYMFMGFLQVRNDARIEEFLQIDHPVELKLNIYAKLIEAMFRLELTSYIDKFIEIDMPNDILSYVKTTIITKLNAMNDHAKIYQLLYQTKKDENQLEIFSHVMYLYGVNNKNEQILQIINPLQKNARDKLHQATIDRFIENEDFREALNYHDIIPFEDDKQLLKGLIISGLVKRSNALINAEIFVNYQIICNSIEKLLGNHQEKIDFIFSKRNELFSGSNFSSEKNILKTFFQIRKSIIYEYIVEEFINYKNMNDSQSAFFRAKLKKLAHYEDAKILSIDQGIDIIHYDKAIFYYVAYHSQIFGGLSNEHSRPALAMLILNWLIPTPLSDTNDNRVMLNKVTSDYFSSKITLGGRLDNFKLFSMKPNFSEIEVKTDEADNKSKHRFPQLK